MNTVNAVQQELPLEFTPVTDRTVINGSLYFVDRDGYRVVFRWELPLYRFALADKVHLRAVAVNLRLSGLVRQDEIAKAFGHTVLTQSRWEHAYQKYGIDGLIPKRPTGRKRNLDKAQEGLVRRWFHEGWSNCEIAKRLSVDESTVRRTLKRLKLVRRTRRSAILPGFEAPVPAVPAADALAADRAKNAEERTGPETTDVLVADSPDSGTPGAEIVATGPESVAETPSPTLDSQRETPAETPAIAPPATPPSSEPVVATRETAAGSEADDVVSFSVDRDPSDRGGDRLLARLGQLEDAVPMFAEHESLPRAGVLLAIPLLARHGLVRVFAKVYGSCLGPSFYGLRTIAVVLFLAALLRIKRPEQLKEHNPADLGAMVGLDRFPEVKTVRRKFTVLAAMQRGKQLMEELARLRMAKDQDRVAFLYVDGHVREYHGKAPLFPAKKPQRQVVTPAATDLWVHDADGEPLLVVTNEVNAHLTQILEPILADVRQIVGQGRRITVDFRPGRLQPETVCAADRAGMRHHHLPQGQEGQGYRRTASRPNGR